MTPRWFLATLVFSLPVLVVTIAVLLSASALAQALGDAAGALVLFWIGMAALILLVVDAVLLLSLLGLRALDGPRDDGEEP